jgi:hypothetical protein
MSSVTPAKEDQTDARRPWEGGTPLAQGPPPHPSKRSHLRPTCIRPTFLVMRMSVLCRCGHNSGIERGGATRPFSSYAASPTRYAYL